MEHENPYIVTRSGRKLHVLYPSTEEICLDDIAFSLSNQCRFTGHVPFYSVAEHSCLVSKIVELEGGSKAEQAWGLMHDAAEAYLGDLNSPVKSSLGLAPYRILEERLLDVIAEKFGLKMPIPEIVREADLTALKAEVSVFFEEYMWPDFGMKEGRRYRHSGIVLSSSMINAKTKFVMRLKGVQSE